MDTSTHQIKYKIDNLKRSFDIHKDEDRVKFAKEASKIIKELKSAVEIDYYTKYLSNQIDISVESIKREVYGKNYNKINNSYKKFDKNKKEEKVIEKPKTITNGEKVVEENLIKIILEDKKLRDLILLKVDENDFILEESKEILNYIIKNKELDKITIDKIESLNICEEYLKDLKSISLDSMNLDDVKSIDEIIKNVKKNTLHEKMNRLLEEQKTLENNKNINDAKEVDGKIMEIALKIVEIRRMLQRL
ncbi:hypothetical protein SDC9_128861 [bioreactor metagenome]|uniref:DNA primase DnaB-helicase binding domain-containing protein n=2 Tax=root TaxID=1 RepID=A0A645CXX7_9ZZZZ